MEPKAHDSVPVRLTEAALKQVWRLMNRENLHGHGLRISMVVGGCSGFSYRLDFESTTKTDDTVIEQEGLTLYVDGPTLDHVKGTVIDFKNGRMTSGFTFENPMASGICGCGTSFAV